MPRGVPAVRRAFAPVPPLASADFIGKEVSRACWVAALLVGAVGDRALAQSGQPVFRPPIGRSSRGL